LHWRTHSRQTQRQDPISKVVLFPHASSRSGQRFFQLFSGAAIPPALGQAPFQGL
jgi:hypothetical protein